MVVSGPCYLNMLWTCAFVIQILLAVLIILRYITAFHANICLVHLWHESVSFNKIGPQNVRLCRGQVLHETVSNQQYGSNQACTVCV